MSKKSNKINKEDSREDDFYKSCEIKKKEQKKSTRDYLSEIEEDID